MIAEKVFNVNAGPFQKQRLRDKRTIGVIVFWTEWLVKDHMAALLYACPL